MLRQRVTAPSHNPPGALGISYAATKPKDPSGRTDAAVDPVLSSKPTDSPSYVSIDADTGLGSLTMNFRSPWMVFAVASGTCAAFNGVFAKLTTTELTTSIAGAIAAFLHLGDGNKVVELTIRAIFFLLNLGFNALMWVLFTRALTLNSSTTRVSILNTSSNFLFTAILGLLIFQESLPPLWFAGAGMLVIGNVVIGRRQQEEDEKVVDTNRVEEVEEGMGLLSRASGDEIEDAKQVKAGVSVSTSWGDDPADEHVKE